MVKIKLLVVGSRKIEKFDLSPYIGDEVTLLISGGATGVDSLAEMYADKHGISKLILRPEYRCYGKRAPLLRNDKMIELADAVLAIWDGKSRGTRYTIEAANRMGKCVTVVNVEKDQ